MIRFFANANYDFIKWRRWAYGLTAVIMLVGAFDLVIRGLNYSIEFTGGTLIQVEAKTALPMGQIRQALDNVGLHGAEIQTFGSDTSYVIRARTSAAADTTGGDTVAVAASVTRAFDATAGAGNYRFERTEVVRPKVGRELQGKAFLAIILSFFVTLIYLAARFEWRFGLAAVLATAHDVLATIAFISLMHIEVSLIVVGAVLTVVGYSLNDTIIIFDRVRENLKKARPEPLYDVLNRSINETLPRSILTHVTVAAATLSLLLFAGEVIRPFSWIMLFGIVTGTFSSIYIAGPVLLWIERRWPRTQGKEGPRPGTSKSAPARPTSPRTPVGAR
jgi:preprotein translocase subunit SecF